MLLEGPGYWHAYSVVKMTHSQKRGLAALRTRAEANPGRDQGRARNVDPGANVSGPGANLGAKTHGPNLSSLEAFSSAWMTWPTSKAHPHVTEYRKCSKCANPVDPSHSQCQRCRLINRLRAKGIVSSTHMRGVKLWSS